MEALQLGSYANQEHLYKSHSSFGPIYASIWLLLYLYSSQVPSVLVPLGDIRPGSCYMLQHTQFDSSTRRWRTADILLQTSKRESCDITSPTLEDQSSRTYSGLTGLWWVCYVVHIYSFSSLGWCLLCQTEFHDWLKLVQKHKISTTNTEHWPKNSIPWVKVGEPFSTALLFKLFFTHISFNV